MHCTRSELFACTAFSKEKNGRIRLSCALEKCVHGADGDASTYKFSKRGLRAWGDLGVAVAIDQEEFGGADTHTRTDRNRHLRNLNAIDPSSITRAEIRNFDSSGRRNDGDVATRDCVVGEEEPRARSRPND